MSPFWFGCAIALFFVVGVVAWLTAGVTLLVKRAIYPKRMPLTQTSALRAVGCEEVKFPSSLDGALLSGWFVPAQTREAIGTVLCCHGMSQNREQMLKWAESLWNSGFNVLLFDFRAVGESEGHKATGGFLEAHDVLGAVDYVASRYDCAHHRIGALGFSMGGSAAIMAAAEEPRICAVATYAAYATLNSAIAARCRFHFGPLGPVVDWGLKLAGRKHFHVQPDDIVPLHAVSSLSPRPLLLLHGDKDQIVPLYNAHQLYESAGEPKALNVIKDGDHEPDHPSTSVAHPTVVQFFRDHLAAYPRAHEEGKALAEATA